MRFDPKRRRYVDEHGKAIPPSQVRKEVIDYIEQERSRTTGEAEKLLKGLITLTAFFHFMDHRIEAWHSVSGAIAYGGKAQLNKTRQARINAKIRSEQKYLAGFKEEVQKSFAAARSIAAQVADEITSQPIKALSRKLAGSLKNKVEKRVFESLIDAAPSEAEARVKRAVIEELGTEGEILSSVIRIAGSLTANLIGGTIVNRAQMYPDAVYATFQNEVANREFDSGVTLGRRLCAEDDASCEECVAAAQNSEEFVPLDELEEIGSLQCLNNCVVAGTMMGGRFYGGLKAVYTGEIINLRTASHKRLTITPNHPVLTEHGFIKAGLLQEGDNLISEALQFEPSTTFNNEKQCPAPIEQILASLAETGWVGTLRRTPIDLHGDGRHVESEIEIVATDGVLLDDGPTAIREGNREIVLKSTDKFPGLKATLRPVRELSVGSSTAPYCPPSINRLPRRGLDAFLPTQVFRLTAISDHDPSLNECRSKSSSGNTSKALQFQHTRAGLIASNSDIYIDSIIDALRSGVPANEQAFGFAANVNVPLSKPAAEDVRSDTEFLRQLREGFPGFIASDPIVEIVRTQVTGLHVYDLSTSVGWQSANGIIISNCRCEFEFSLEGSTFATSDVFEGVVGGQDAYGGDVVIQ